MRALIADDHPLTREGLVLAVRAALPGVNVDQAGSIAEAEDLIARHRSYRIAVLDFGLPDAQGFSGLMQLQHLLAGTPILMVSARTDQNLVEAACAVGAAGFVHKIEGIDAIARTVRAVAAGQRVFPADAIISTDLASIKAQIETLTSAQHRVLLAMADGRSNKQIAGELDVTEATIKAHASAIFRKLGVSNRAKALLAIQPLLGKGV